MTRNNADFQGGRFVSMEGHAAQKVGISFDRSGGGLEGNAAELNFKNGNHTWVNLPADVPLKSTQTTFDTAGVRHYYDSPNERLPETKNSTPMIWRDTAGNHWVHDGHHRIIASRLRGDASIHVKYTTSKTKPVSWEPTPFTEGK